MPEDWELIHEEVGDAVFLLDANTLVPGMTLAELEQLDFSYFPERAGWYYQQFNKLAFGLLPRDSNHYLIWDADTIPLKPMDFFTEDGCVWFNGSDEFHLPYFENYARLLGHGADREFSFISEHMVVDCRILKEMLGAIEQRFTGTGGWAWKIMHNLAGNDISLFSEYETYGHFVKMKHGATARYRYLPWSRAVKTRGFEPPPELLKSLAREFYYATFEIYSD